MATFVYNSRTDTEAEFWKPLQVQNSAVSADNCLVELLEWPGGESHAPETSA